MADKKMRFITGAGSIGRTEQKVADLQEQIDAYRDLSRRLSLSTTCNSPETGGKPLCAQP